MGDLVIGSSQTSHELAFPPGTRLPEDAPEGFSQQQWDKFRAEHPQGPVYRDQLQSMNLDQEGVTTKVESSTYGAAGAAVTAGHQEVDGVRQVLQGYQNSGAEAGSEVVIDGHRLEVGSSGIFLDGQEVVLPADLAGKFASGGLSLGELSQLFKSNPKLVAQIPLLGRISGSLGLVGGLLAFAAADSIPAFASATAGTLGGVSGLATLGTAARASTVAKGTGLVGGGLQVGVGVWEILGEHNYAEGAADIVGGVGVALLPSWWPIQPRRLSWGRWW